MFDTRLSTSPLAAAFRMAELIYHSAVREVRKSHRNAVVGLLLSLVQSIVMVLSFYLIFALMGVRTAAIRGDYMTYIMTGILPFMMFSKAMGAVSRAEGPASPMMQHAPLNPIVSMAAGALSALYLQMLATLVLLFLYHMLWNPVVIDDPVAALGMLMLAWFFGVAMGVLFYALRPWTPELSGMLTQVWSRLNMIASGKMFVANQLPPHMLVIFAWNPLFHIIDQMRGHVFLHYEPHNSNTSYAFWASLALLVLGLMAQSYTRRHASMSWGATR